MDSILVLGGTGAMGGYLVTLLSKNYEVHVTSRKSKHSIGNIHYYKGDAHNIEFLNSVLIKGKYKAIVDFMNYSTEEYRSRYELLLNSTEQLFYISSSRVYSKVNGQIVESDKRLLDSSTDLVFLKTDDYALAKARQEDILKNNSKRNWTIIRPYMTYSPNRLDIGMYAKELWLYRVLKGRTVIFPKDVAEKKVTLTNGKDVAKGIMSLIGKPAAMSETFHITQTKAYSWKEIVEYYIEELTSMGLAPKIKWIEVPASDEGYIYHYDRLYDRVFDNSKISQFVDVSQFIDAKAGIRECLSIFLTRPVFLDIDWKKQAYWDGITGEHARRDEFKTLKDYLVYLSFRYILPYNLLQKMLQKIKKI